MFFLSLILAIIAIVLCISINNRLFKLEQLLMDKKLLSEKDLKITTVVEVEKPKAKQKKSTKSKVQKTPSPSIVSWLLHEWPVKLGALLLLLGFGWLVTYAFVNDWIGPVGRIIMGVLAGTLIYALGEIRIKKYSNQGAIFIALGSAISILTLYAARNFYEFLTPAIALLLMALFVVATAYSGVRHKNQKLSVLGLLWGGIAPLLVNSPDPSFFGLFGYLLVLSAGTLWLVSITSWKKLNLLSILIVITYTLSFPENLNNNIEYFLTGMIFVLLFYATNLISLLKAKKSSLSDLSAAGLITLYSIGWISQLESGHEGILCLMIAALFVFGAWALKQNQKIAHAFNIYLGMAIIFLASATAFEFTDQNLVFAYILEATIITALGAYLYKSISLGNRLSLLMVIPGLMAAESLDSGLWKDSLFHHDFFITVLFIVCTAFLATFLKLGKFNKQKSLPLSSALLYTATGVYSVIFIWLSIHAIPALLGIHKLIAFSIYMIAAIYMYFKGRSINSNFLKLYGGFLLGLITLRLLTVEVWEMELAERIVTFITLGVLLLGTGFLKEKKK